jgi:hypothetical protein
LRREFARLTCACDIDDDISRGAADFVDRLKIANHPFMLLKTRNPNVRTVSICCPMISIVGSGWSATASPRRPLFRRAMRRPVFRRGNRRVPDAKRKTAGATTILAAG